MKMRSGRRVNAITVDFHQGTRKCLWYFFEKNKNRLFCLKIDSSLTSFREKNTSQLLDFDFFNLLVTDLRNLEYRISAKRYQSETSTLEIPFSTTNRGKNTHRAKREFAFYLPLSMIFHYPSTTHHHARVIAAECAWRTRRAKLKNQNAGPLSLELRVIIISIGTHPTHVFVLPNATYRRSRVV